MAARAIVEIEMSGPGKNALGSEMMDSLIARLATANGAPVLLTGAGDAFSAGLNLRELASLDGARMGAFLEKLDAVMDALFRYPGPTAAAVNGHAIAGGCLLAICCDHRVALDDEKVKIGLNEVALGLRFPVAVLEIVRHRVASRHLDEIVLGAALHAPARALELGLVDELAADPRAAARKWLESVATHPAEAYRETKLALRARALSIPAEERKRFIAGILPAWTAPGVKERIAALLGKKS